MPRKLAPDLWLFGVAVVLLSVGVVMVYSASAIVAGDRFHDPYFFLKRQLCWALLGAAGLWVALRVDYRRLERFVLPLLVVSVALLVLVLIPPIGQAINGTRRWIRRSEEHTSELQSRLHLVCRLLLEKKKTDLASSSHYLEEM